eukprot:CAMPEP_0117760690 /NCGR_PEP_ID=MMETSP0947-20121206/16791_1 /TAXON_ID=44440 /ORGANISM="Chattonella subsalsa, Strain CCMP2191" /LENGTH=181 /DNA_ID=CAMNT_0005581451 /DNA_START=172 /DNA_END=717 /DNA_ORIENTATION=-
MRLMMSEEAAESESLVPPTLVPPDPTPFQSRQERRRSLPKQRLERPRRLSQLQKKPRYNERLAAQSTAEEIKDNEYGKDLTKLFKDKEDEEGVLVPLIPKMDKRSGEDYYIDPSYKEKPVKAPKPPAADQIPQEKLRDEIVSPYKNNWILIISATIVGIAVFSALFPDALNPPSINFPQDL